MLGFKNRARGKGTKEKAKEQISYTTQIDTIKQFEEIIRKTVDTEEMKFSEHMSGYIGNTVTVFVRGGGAGGAGFTGILSEVNDIYLQLITRIGPVPACSLGNSSINFCKGRDISGVNSCMCTYKPIGAINSFGSITCIPVEKVVSFVHNAI